MKILLRIIFFLNSLAILTLGYRIFYAFAMFRGELVASDFVSSWDILVFLGLVFLTVFIGVKAFVKKTNEDSNRIKVAIILAVIISILFALHGSFLLYLFLFPPTITPR